MSSTVTITNKTETPFTSGALRSQNTLDFWESYVRSRPSPTEDFFQLIEKYHKTHGDDHTGICHDVGTGPGNIAARLAGYFDHVVGSDVNGDALAAAPHLVPSKDLHRLSFIQSRAEDLARTTPTHLGAQGKTDLITVSECIPLLDAPQALQAFHTLLRPGGTLAIYFYGPALFTDGNGEDDGACNAAYDRVATRICTLNQPMKGTSGFPFHLRAAETLASYLDNIALPMEEWESIQRYKWNCDQPLIFNSAAGFDFEFPPIDRRGEAETIHEAVDRDLWAADWSIREIGAYLDSVYPNYRDKAGPVEAAEVEALLTELDATMGRSTRRVTFPVVLVLATKRDATNKTNSNQVSLSPDHLGLGRVNFNPPDSITAANRLLQKNHDEFHVFWRDVNGHNHMAHSLLTTVALGGGPKDLQRAYNDGIGVQRARPELDLAVVESFSDEQKLELALGQLPQYTNVLTFFQREIERLCWQATLQKYCFARTPLADAILSRLYEGAYHPIIHLGLGVEFEQPSIIAEGLAQAVTHSLSGIPHCLLRSEQEHNDPSDSSSRPLIDLYHSARANDIIFRGPRWEDLANKMKDGVLGRSQAAITRLVAQFRVFPLELHRRAAEVINCSAYMAGAAQQKDKVPKIDFFYMHAVTSSLFLTVFLQQDWISLEDKVRLVEFKGRTDLMWYAGSGCAELKPSEITQYKGQAGRSSEMSWSQLYEAVNEMHDDGHVGKFVRALKSGQEVSQPFEQGHNDRFPMQGADWLSLARMAYDSTVGLSDEAKWVWGVGFQQAWANVPSRL